MRGSPVLRALVVFLLLLSLAPALWQMTRAKEMPQPVPGSDAAPAREQALPVQLAFTLAPKRVAISHLGKEVWAKENPEAEEELELKVSWPAEGGELLFTIAWPEDASLAGVRVKLADPERGDIERSLFGRGPKTGVLRFP